MTTPLDSHVLELLEQALLALRVRLDAIDTDPTPEAFAALRRTGEAVFETGKAVVEAGRGRDPP